MPKQLEKPQLYRQTHKMCNICIQHSVSTYESDTCIACCDYIFLDGKHEGNKYTDQRTKCVQLRLVRGILGNVSKENRYSDKETQVYKCG